MGRACDDINAESNLWPSGETSAGGGTVVATRGRPGLGYLCGAKKVWAKVEATELANIAKDSVYVSEKR